MKPKTLAIAAFSAVVLTALGLALRGLRQPAAAGAHSGDLLFPDLLDSINEVASIQVTTPDGDYRILRKEGVWGVAEKGGYPVDAGQVTKTLFGFAELEKIEPKTSDPARYAELGVQDLEAEGATSKLVVLRDGEEKDLAALIVGERRTGRGNPSIYVRRVDDPQSWLVEGNLDIREDGTAWLDKKILEVKRDEVRAVETTHPDGDAVLVSKQSHADEGFQVEHIPPDRELKYPTVANGMGGALEYLNLEDVLPAAEFEQPEGEPVRTSYWTFDGLRIDVSIHEKEEKTYATFRASYDAEGPASLAAIGPVPPPEGSEEADAPDEAAPDAGAAEGQAEAPRPPEEVRAEAEKLNARLEPWVFEIPAYNKTNFAKRMSDMLKEVEAEKPEEGAPDAPPGGEALEGSEQEDLEAQIEKLLEGQGLTDESAGVEDPQDEAGASDDGAGEEPEKEKPEAETPPAGGDEPPGSGSAGQGPGENQR